MVIKYLNERADFNKTQEGQMDEWRKMQQTFRQCAKSVSDVINDLDTIDTPNLKVAQSKMRFMSMAFNYMTEAYNELITMKDLIDSKDNYEDIEDFSVDFEEDIKNVYNYLNKMSV